MSDTANDSSSPSALSAEEEEQRLHSKILRQAFVLNYDEHAVQVKGLSGDERLFERIVGCRREFERRVLGIERCPKTGNIQEIQLDMETADIFVLSGGCHGRFIWMNLDVWGNIGDGDIIVHVKLDFGLLAAHLKLLDLRFFRSCWTFDQLVEDADVLCYNGNELVSPLSPCDPLFAAIPRVRMRLLERLNCPYYYGEFPSVRRNFNVVKDSFSNFFPRLKTLGIDGKEPTTAIPQEKGQFALKSLKSLRLYGGVSKLALSKERISVFAKIEALLLENVDDSDLNDCLVGFTALNHFVASTSNLEALPAPVKARWSKQVTSLGITAENLYDSIPQDLLEWKSVKSLMVNHWHLSNGLSLDLLDQWRKQIMHLKVDRAWPEIPDNIDAEFFTEWNFKSLELDNVFMMKPLRVPGSVEALDLRHVRVFLPHTLPCLRLMSLSDCDIEGGSSHKVSLPNLEILDVARGFLENQFPMIDAPKIQKISISSCSNPTPSAKKSTKNIIDGLSKSHSSFLRLREVQHRGTCAVSPTSDDHWALVKKMAANNYLDRHGTHLSFFEHEKENTSEGICGKTHSAQNADPVPKKKSTRTPKTWISMLSKPFQPFSAEGTMTVKPTKKIECKNIEWYGFCPYSDCSCQRHFRENQFKPVFELKDELSATYLLLRNDLSWLEMVNGCPDENANAEPEGKRRRLD